MTGQREGARRLVNDLYEHDEITTEEIVQRIFWPALGMINSLFRADQLTTLAHNYAIRLLRGLIDQAQAHYETQPANGKKVLMFCGTSEADELAGQLTADFVEAGGYEVFFGGGGIANDEILGEVGEHRPDILLMFASAPTDAPNIRTLIDKIREVNACPDMQIVVGGGVFNRAEGLAEEIGADLWARDPQELRDKLDAESTRRAEPGQRTVGKTRRTRNAA
ncbi:MAG: hypothetical protein EA377_12560 [Phycisphaerales bacterium]|nr:MAG: hypothetical protein EA377_12560 [Phycisphaerales bacterium]